MSLDTTVQLDRRTRNELFKVVARLQARLGRRVTFDEAIMTLIHETRGVSDARTRFDALFGSLQGDREAWHELDSLRRRELYIAEKV